MNIKPCYDCLSVMDRVVNLIYFGEDCFEEGSEEDWGDD